MLEHKKDIARIMGVSARRGVYLSQEKAQEVWKARSASMAAGWLILPEDDDSLWTELWFEISGSEVWGDSSTDS